MKRAINLLNVALLAMCGYVYGYHQGYNTEKPVDNQVAINYAVYKALTEGQ